MSAKLGKLVKEARTAKGLSQAALADLVDGLTASDVSKIERGEKEPSQAVLRKMAKPLGVTQKSLLDALSGTGKTSSSSGKTSSASGKTSSGSKKTTGKGKTTASAEDEFKLTATEKKLIRLYRKADASTKKEAMNLLSGEGNLLEMVTSMLSGKTGSSGASGKNSELIEGLMQAFMKK